MKKLLLFKKLLFSTILGLFLNQIGHSQSNPTFVNSTSNFTVPAGVTSLTVEAWGGGGAGSNGANAAGGGGGGAYTRGIMPVTPGAVISIVIGNGGIVGAFGAPGTNGGTTMVSTIVAGGGIVGNNRTGGAGGGASPISGLVTASFAGGAGGSARVSTTGILNEAGGGGGGSAFFNATGGAGAIGAASLTIATAGGTGTAVGGVGAAADGLPDATIGNVPGSGGGGRGEGASLSYNGGKGQVRISWTNQDINVLGGSPATSILTGDIAPTFAKGTDFLSQNIATGYVSRTFIIQNLGGATLNITNPISITGLGASDYTISTPPASTVLPGASTSFILVFNPSIVGVKNATITINNNDPDEAAYNFILRGSGDVNLGPEINVRGGIPVSDIAIGELASAVKGTDFGTMNVYVGTVTRTFTIQNTGTGLDALTISSITFSGIGAADYTVTTAAASPFTVSTTFVVTFNPSVTGDRPAQLSIANNDTNENPYTFSLIGKGLVQDINIQGGNPIVNILTGDNTPTVAKGSDFGAQNFNFGSISRTFTIQNTGSDVLTLTNPITISGSTDFTITTQPAITSIPAGGFITFVVTFDPTIAAIRNGIVNIINNDVGENPYTFSIIGTGNSTASSEINVLGGIPSATITIGEYPTIIKGTDFGAEYIFSEATIVRSFTITNTGNNNLTIGAIIFSGVGALDFKVTTAPAGSIAVGGSTTFVITFDPNGAGSRDAVVSIASNDPNENPYTFNIKGIGNTFLDSDGDNVTDNIDIDDDNDGIIDTEEQTSCSVPSSLATDVEIFYYKETFGTGTDRTVINVTNPAAICSYTPEPGNNVNDGRYQVYYKIGGATGDITNITPWSDYAWVVSSDYTPGDVNGRMAVFNAEIAPKTFYENTIIGVLPNIPVTYSFFAMNIDRSNEEFIATGHASEQPRLLPSIRIEFLTLSEVVLATYDTGDITRCLSGTCVTSDWKPYSFSANLGENTAFKIRLSNLGPGGLGNDLAMDDIFIKQKYCDNDSDGQPDIFDLDADNDGIPDVVEAGFKNLTNNKSKIDVADGVIWKDVNSNGMNDAIDTFITNGTYTTNYLKDTDNDGIRDYIDLDSDNDTKFDIDEANTDNFSTFYNGDGDIDGDGKGEIADFDKDGIQDLNDDKDVSGNPIKNYGTIFKSYPVDRDVDGIPDYLDIKSDGINFDVASTLFFNLDLNLDGIIDLNTDTDKDGIVDGLDSKSDRIGSPRDIMNRKLLIDFDGRNDYAEAPVFLSNAANGTIMGWIKLSASFVNDAFVMGNSDFSIAVNASKQLVVTAKGQVLTFTTALNVNRWYHVGAVFSTTDSAEKLKLFLNGKKELISNANALSGNLATSTTKFTIAKSAMSANNYFRGFIDEVRIFDAALSDTQFQKMVYQEIDLNGVAIRGTIIPKDIELSTWASLLAYYRLDDYKNDVIDDLKIASTDDGLSATFARIYNVKYIQNQTAPMPFVTLRSDLIENAVENPTEFIKGTDVNTYDWSIVNVKHNVTSDSNRTDLGLFINEGNIYTANNNNRLQNSWYLKLDGKIDLQGKAQLIQTATSDLDPASIGNLERDQQGQNNVYNYNYWSSPVGAINNTTNNNAFNLLNNMKDGTNPASIQSINWTESTYEGDASTSPITMASYWIFKFQNLANDYANWSNVGPYGDLLPGEGYTLKGSGAATATQNYTFIGKPNNGDISIPIAANNLNLAGNPYSSAIDAREFILNNLDSLDGTLYFWEHFSTNITHNLGEYQGGYAARTIVGGTPPVSPTSISGLGSSSRIPARFIPVGQGFFITGSSTGGSVKFSNNQRLFVKEDNLNSNIMFKTNSAPSETSETNNALNTDDTFEEDTFAKIRLGFNSSINYHRQLLLGFMNEEATSGFDFGYDARLFDQFPTDVYFINGENNLIIQGDGYFNLTNTYPLAVKTNEAGTVQFVIDQLENFDTLQNVYIFDNLTSTYHQINENPFEINLEAGLLTDRFSLRFTDGTLDANNFNTENITLTFANNNNHLIITNKALKTTVNNVSVFNILGQNLQNWNVENNDQSKIELPVKNYSSGTYIVKLNTSNGIISQKIIIK